MTAAGLIVMLTSVSSVICMLTFCLYRVMTLPPHDDDDS